MAQLSRQAVSLTARPVLGRSGERRIGCHSPPRASWWLYLPPLVVGLAVRLGFALLAPQPALPSGADQYYYRGQAELLTHGYWWVVPGTVGPGHTGVPGAAHPPLFSALLAIADLVGLRGMDGQRALLAVLSVAAVVFCGRIGARLAGRTAELVVAWVAAVLPGMWIYSGQVLSETVTVPLVAGTVLACYRLREKPTAPRALVLGLMVGLCALTRPELGALAVIFAPLLVVSGSARSRLALSGVFLIGVMVLVGPWVGRNLHDYRHRELLSANLGSVVLGGSCDRTYSGPLLGAWDSRCVSAVVPPPGDASTTDQYFLAAGERYAGAHLNRVPVVVAARVGRSLGVWPISSEAVSWDATAGGVWPRWSSWLYLTTWLVSIPFVVVAVVALRRRKIVAWPLYVLIGLFFAISAALCANPRYASSCQAALAILVGVGLTTTASALSRRHQAAGAARHYPVKVERVAVRT